MTTLKITTIEARPNDIGWNDLVRAMVTLGFKFAGFGRGFVRANKTIPIRKGVPFKEVLVRAQAA